MSAITTYLLYNFILVVASSFAYLVEYGNTKQFRFCSRVAVFLILWIPAALRYDTGTDYMSYIEIFNKTYSLSIEGGYRVLNNIIYSLGLSAEWVFVVTSFLIYFPICFIVKRRNYFYFILFYILLFFYLRSYSAIRQTIAVSFVTAALVYLDDRKFVKFIILLTFAMFMHISTLMVLPLLALKLVTFKTRAFPILIMIFGMIVLYWGDVLSLLLSVLKVVGNKYYQYAYYFAGDTYHFQGGTILTFFAMFVRSSMLFLAVYFTPEIIKKDKKANFILNMAIIYNYVNIFALKYRIVGRVRDILMWVPINASGLVFRHSNKYRKIFIFLIIALNIGLFEYNIQQYNRDFIGPGIYPYHSIFSKYK